MLTEMLPKKKTKSKLGVKWDDFSPNFCILSPFSMQYSNMHTKNREDRSPVQVLGRYLNVDWESTALIGFHQQYESGIWKRPLELHDKTELMFLCRRHHYDVGIMTFTHDIHTVQIMEIPCLSASRGPYWIVIKSLAHNNQSPPPSHGTTHNAEREKWDQPQALLFKKTSVTSPIQEAETREKTFLFQPSSWSSSWIGWR